jgi:signal transduction histidine kinase
VIHSLRVRLLVMVAVVLGIALGAVALFSVRVVSVEFRHYLAVRGPRPEDLDRVAARLNVERRRRGDWSGAHRILAEAGRRMGRELLVVDPAGRLAAATSPEETYGRVRVAEGGRRLDVERKTARGRGGLRLVEPYRVTLAAPGGEPLGTLFVISLPSSAPSVEPGSAEVVGRIRRVLLLAALAAGAVGLLLSFALARRILRPVEALTAAARRMEAGDLAQRVEVRERNEIGELARAFNAMAERRATAERLRRDLVNDVAHELRSPLTNLRGQLEALEDGLLAPSTETLASLVEEVRLLGRLVDDLQDLALAEAGQLALERGPVDLGAEIERAVKAAQPRAAALGLRVRVCVEADPPAALPAVDGDARRIAQILRNLLDNAVTCTPPGGCIRVRARPGDGEVAVEVEDTGPGIPPGHLPHLFDRFYRTDASRSRTTGGAGLGLAIVRQLAEAHGGRVWVESEVGKGSTFGFSLPAERVESENVST